MKPIFLIFCGIMMFKSIAGMIQPDRDTIRIYVSPEGNDSNMGTINVPVKSFEAARDLVRNIQNKENPVPVLICFSGGKYELEEPVILQSKDSGSENALVIYTAKENETPEFTGSKPLKNWKILTDQKKLSLLDKSVHGKVYVTDLKSEGITDFGDPTNAGKRPELYCNKKLQTLARWPNNGFTNAGLAKGVTELPPTYMKVHGTVEGDFEFQDNRQKRWGVEEDVRLGGYWYWDWSEEYQKVGKMDTVYKIINIAKPYHHYGYKDNLRYFGLNLICEIDEPGEWYLERSTGLLYWFPPNGISPDKAEITLTNFAFPFMVEMQDCNNIVLQGLTFTEGRGSSISVKGGKYCLIRDCRIERFGLDGIHVDGGENHWISGCFLSDFGYGGIKIKGGDRKTLKPANHFIVHSIVRNFSLFKRTYEPAVHADGCGMRFSNNKFSNSSSSAMRLEGNDFLVELNEVDNVVNESDDQGGIDIFYNPSYQGIVIRYNHWKDITGGTRHGAAGVRLDDMISGVEIYGNIFENCGARDFGGVQIHGGKDNIVENNLFYKCNAAVSFSAWNPERWLEALERPEIKKKLYEDVDILSQTYQEKYPALKDLSSNPNRNFIRNNLIAGCNQEFLRNGKYNIFKNNKKISAKNKGLKSLCDSKFLAKHRLNPIPFEEVGPFKNKWVRQY